MHFVHESSIELIQIIIYIYITLLLNPTEVYYNYKEIIIKETTLEQTD